MLLTDGMDYIHIYRCENPKRTRKICPYHKRLEYGELQDFYDTRRIFFDCGTMVDYGYGYYYPPKQYLKLRISQNNGLWQVWNRFWQKLAESKSKSAIIRIAKCHLKPGGIIKEF